MIRVNRGPEPPELAPIRTAELARVEALAAVRPLESEDFGKLYKGTSSDPELFRRLLNEAQHGKCCFCEMLHASKRRDLEHFRPKTAALGSDSVTRQGWWWLAWTWENLLFSCDYCNQDHKKTHFPLRDERLRLLAKDAPPGLEEALLLDPSDATINPLNHIQFKLIPPTGDWWPFPRAGSVYGEHTIRICGLRRPQLIDAYRKHHNSLIEEIKNLKEDLQSADDAQECGDPAPMAKQRARWDRLVRAKFQSTMQLTGLTIDIFDHYFPEPLRKEYGLSWP